MGFNKLFFLATLLFSICANANELSSQQIEKWLKAAPTVAAWVKQHNEQLHQSGDIDFAKSSPDVVASQAQTALKKLNLYDEFNRMVKQQGYSGVESFFKVQTQVVQSFIAMTMQAANIPDDAQQKLRQSLAEIDATDGLSADQKQMLKQQMLQIMGQLEQVTNSSNLPSEDKNIQAIKPYAQQVEKMLSQFGD
ncbi:hypothetical protein [Catenovulum sediminis]|uniref:Uncharacterized protein n=1 Tax=Catenovulum sediminis TaxID=1740262 RepID=A0ABV1RGT1_9ALTE|nr:hypothetical protein [Catenovulum sediminis]